MAKFNKTGKDIEDLHEQTILQYMTLYNVSREEAIVLLNEAMDANLVQDEPRTRVHHRNFAPQNKTQKDEDEAE